MLTEGGAQVRARSGVPATCTLHSRLATRPRPDPQIVTLEGGAAAGRGGGCRGVLAQWLLSGWPKGRDAGLVCSFLLY